MPGVAVGEAYLGAQLLSTTDPIEAAHLAQLLDQYNQERRAIEERIQEEACYRQRPRPIDRSLWYTGKGGIPA